uniref:Uncharacterized protein n=1 Tax=Arundo donax TaxID=35708 RepID=A0A0A9A5Y2_ARUDO
MAASRSNDQPGGLLLRRPASGNPLRLQA